jgi:hypothetical protein
LTLHDLTLSSDASVRVALPVEQQLVYVCTASVPVPYVTTHLRTPAKLEQVVTTQSIINPDGSYVIPETIDSGGLTLTPPNGVTSGLEAEERITSPWLLDSVGDFSSCSLYVPNTFL